MRNNYKQLGNANRLSPKNKEEIRFMIKRYSRK